MPLLFNVRSACHTLVEESKADLSSSLRECNVQRAIVGDPSGRAEGGTVTGSTRLLSMQHRIRLDRRIRTGAGEATEVRTLSYGCELR